MNSGSTSTYSGIQSFMSGGLIYMDVLSSIVFQLDDSLFSNNTASSSGGMI